jgi:hypothetical protein
VLSGDSLHDVIRFDVRVDRSELCGRLQSRHLVWIEVSDGEQWLCVAVGANADELAVVLRTVEAWAIEHDLAGVRYQLDDREYVLRGLHAIAG